MRFIALLLLVPSFALAQPTAPAGWQALPQGQLLLRAFAHAPYPHASRERGFQSKTANYSAAEHYSDSTVALFIPAGYTPGDAVDYVVHFHGHNNHVAKVVSQYKLAEQFAESKLNAILIVPQGPKDAPDSGGGKLELDQGAFTELLTEITAFLKAEEKIRTTTVGRVMLSSHSGGYKVTAAVLDRGGELAGHITDVLLLDSSYGSLESYARWAAGAAGRRLVSLHTQHLDAANRELVALLDKSGTAHQELEEAALNDEQLTRRSVLFVATKTPHDEVPVVYFGRLLRTSGAGR